MTEREGIAQRKAWIFFKNSGLFYILLAGLFFRIIISGNKYPSSNYILIIIFSILILFNLPASGRGLWLSRPVQACLLVFFAALVLSIPLGIQPSSSLREMAVFFQYLLIFIAIVRFTSRERIPIVLLVMVLAGLISVAWGLRQFFGGFESTLELVQDVNPYIVKVLTERRIFGLTLSPDMLAGLCIMLIPVAMGLAFASARSEETPSRMSLILISTPALLLSAGLILTRSLGGWLGGILGIAIFFIISARKFRISLKAWMALASASAVIMGAAFAWLISTRGEQFADFKSRNNPVILRALNYKASAMVYKERPLTGVGLGNLGLAYPRYRSIRGNEIQYVHNNYLQILAETGPAGLVGLLGLAIMFLFAAYRQQARDENGKSYILRGVLAAGAAFLVHSLVDFDLYTPEVGAVFFMLLGLVAVGEQCPDPLPSAGMRVLRGLLALGILFFMAGSLYLCLVDRDLDKVSGLIHSGKPLKAEGVLRSHMKWYEREARAHLYLARALRLQGSFKDEVIREYRMAQALNPRSAFYHDELGDYFLETVWIQAAESEYRRAVEIYPNKYEFNLALGLLLFKQKNYEESETVLKHAVRCTWNNYDARLYLARLYLDQERKEDAKEILERLIEVFPENQAAWVLLWQIYDEENNKILADQLKDEIIKRWPRMPEAGMRDY